MQESIPVVSITQVTHCSKICPADVQPRRSFGDTSVRAVRGGIRQALREHPIAQGVTPRVTVFVGAKVEGPNCREDVVEGNCAARHLPSGVLVPRCPPLFGKTRIALVRALAGPEGSGLVQDGDRRL